MKHSMASHLTTVLNALFTILKDKADTAFQHCSVLKTFNVLQHWSQAILLIGDIWENHFV